MRAEDRKAGALLSGKSHCWRREGVGERYTLPSLLQSPILLGDTYIDQNQPEVRKPRKCSLHLIVPILLSKAEKNKEQI